MDERLELLDRTDLFVLDMDGTFYLGEQILPGALDFLSAVRERGKRFLFFTNNSSKSPEDYIKKLAGMGCAITREQIMTSGDVTIRYLSTHHPGKTVYLVGTPALEASFRESGIPLTRERPDIVVVGFDTTLTYEKLERACTYIREGALFLATHPDINCPVQNGSVPDCGAFCAAIQLSTGKEPRVLGKPFPETADMVLDRTGGEKCRTAFVGDRLYTDVATGVRNGAMGLLVLTGETRREDLADSTVTPDAVFEGLAEMAALLRSRG